MAARLAAESLDTPLKDFSRKNQSPVKALARHLRH
jgi:hypothetical protein